jgi:hypothetical protein
VATYIAHPKLAFVAGSLYLFFVLIIGADVVRGRKAKDHAHAELLKAFLGQLHREVFHSQESARFTLFRPSPFDRNRLVAWYRFQRGTEDLISEAAKSRASYVKGEGFTGGAWLNAGNELICALLPPFRNRADLEQYYVANIQVQPQTARQISDAMINVRTILSYGFLDEMGDFLGVLSIDLTEPIEVSEDDPYPRIGGHHLYADAMAYNFRSIGTVLECLKKAEI